MRLLHVMAGLAIICLLFGLMSCRLPSRGDAGASLKRHRVVCLTDEDDGDVQEEHAPCRPAKRVSSHGHLTGSPVQTPHDSRWPAAHELHEAAAAGDLEGVRALADSRGISLDARDGDGRTALLLAAARGHVEVVAYLARRGADVDAVDRCGTPALVLAAEGNHACVVRVLLEHHVNVEAKELRLGATALHIAARDGRKDVAAALLEGGASPNSTAFLKMTPLHAAVGEGHAGLAELLIRHGARVDERSSMGQTPLHLAAYMDEVDVVKVLMANAADPNLRDDQGRTPYVLAQCEDSDGVVSLLTVN